jgi:hypothetical protein
MAIANNSFQKVNGAGSPAITKFSVARYGKLPGRKFRCPGVKTERS